MKRREFLRASIFLGGSAAFNSFPYELFASEQRKEASDRIQLGQTGLEVSRLALGTGTNGVRKSSNQTRRFGVQGIAELFQAAYDDGMNFWDSADQYGSHPHLKEALKYVPREKVVILSKTHASTEQEMRADLDRFRRELGTDYIDIVLLHCMMNGNWPTQRKGAMAVLSEAREAGIIRAHGVSCHTLPALRAAARSPWVQVDLARINPAGVSMDSDVSTVLSVLKEMKQAGKAVIGMKILGAGRLRNRVDECLQFALAQESVDCFTIGVESRQEYQDLVRRIPEASVRV